MWPICRGAVLHIFFKFCVYISFLFYASFLCFLCPLSLSLPLFHLAQFYCIDNSIAFTISVVFFSHIYTIIIYITIVFHTSICSIYAIILFSYSGHLLHSLTRPSFSWKSKVNTILVSRPSPWKRPRDHLNKIYDYLNRTTYIRPLEQNDHAHSTNAYIRRPPTQNHLYRTTTYTRPPEQDDHPDSANSYIRGPPI